MSLLQQSKLKPSDIPELRAGAHALMDALGEVWEGEVGQTSCWLTMHGWNEEVFEKLRNLCYYASNLKSLVFARHGDWVMAAWTFTYAMGTAKMPKIIEEALRLPGSNGPWLRRSSISTTTTTNALRGGLVIESDGERYKVLLATHFEICNHTDRYYLPSIVPLSILA